MQRESDKLSLKNDFLSAYQSISFTKTHENTADVERRRLAVKYLTASKFESEEAAALLLGEGLKQYRTLVEKSGLIENMECPDNKDRARWKSTLKDVGQALLLIKPLPCQRNSADRICGRRNPMDRDVENLIKSREINGEERPARKIALPQSNRNDQQNHRKMDRENSPYSCYDGLRNNSKITRPKAEDEDFSKKYDETEKSGPFRSAKTELHIQQQQKANKKSLGGKAAVNSKFVCPLKREKEREDEKNSGNPVKEGQVEDERLRGIDEKLIELVRNEIMDSGATVSWDDVAGLEHAKKTIKEIIVLPMLRPDIFTGLRRPPKGILLFGPPGTGKTLIGKCIASQSKSTFFSISASSLTSKWIGEGEKMVRALFAVARVHQPSVIFIDEIDSLLTQRSETEHESSRRIKTEFLVQLDGAATGEEDRILVIGATNRPQELDEAARRRFVKRLYVPLPEYEARRQIVRNLLAAERHELTELDIDNIAKLSEHYSGADMTNLCKEASMGPIRSIPFELLESISKEDVRCVTAADFKQALTYVRPSVSQSDLGLYVDWDRTYGSGTSSIGIS